MSEESLSYDCILGSYLPTKDSFPYFQILWKKILLASQKYLQISILIYPQVKQSDFYIPHLTQTWKWWNHWLTTFSLKCLASWSEQQYRREDKSINKIQVKKNKGWILFSLKIWIKFSKTLIFLYLKWR